ncbi:MAG: SGNH/GDSL hydrolase family protein, partial [Planctomyces sp.]
TSDYVRKMIEIRTAADQVWKSNRPWLPAKSTLHPTVYHDAHGETQIRTAIDQLWSTPGFQRGPDTDTLTGHNRGLPGSRRHFTGAGQRNAAALWFAEVMNLLNEPRPGYEAVLPHLNQMHLLAPAWNSEVVYRESSILLQEGTDGPIKARLAFPAAEVLSVVSAAGDRRFDSATDFQLSEDGLSLTFRPEALKGSESPGSSATFPIVRSEDLYPPAGSPNSYAHRVGHPDQHLLYNAGRWFHDRNVEITYRRADGGAQKTESVSAGETVSHDLPGTKAILTSGRSLTIAVSGDSISTGLDASLTASAPPGQPGYPDLVAAQLKQKFGSEIRLVNRAVAGWSVSHGVQDSESLMASKPDLVIVAYGMNDVGRRDPDWFENQTRVLITKIRDAAPNAEIILVASMRGNQEWIPTPTEMFGP